MRKKTPAYHVNGIAHADELASQEMRSVPNIEVQQEARSQPQSQSQQSQSQGPEPKVKSKSWVKANRDVKLKRWVLWVIGGVILILVGVSAVLGGILGSRALRSKDNNDAPTASNITSNGTSPTGNTPNVTPVQPIRSGSRLDVPGHRTKTDYSIRLLYQDKDNQIRFTDKDSISAN
ncbi:hypothetical protein F4804DRAFT_330109 [Jackrogersella minutella]|nr:hypothetical protein F4804DRAFT_330109 [Jackrogersella minutella]